MTTCIYTLHIAVKRAWLNGPNIHNRSCYSLPLTSPTTNATPYLSHTYRYTYTHRHTRTYTHSPQTSKSKLIPHPSHSPSSTSIIYIAAVTARRIPPNTKLLATTTRRPMRAVTGAAMVYAGISATPSTPMNTNGFLRSYKHIIMSLWNQYTTCKIYKNCCCKIIILLSKDN